MSSSTEKQIIQACIEKLSHLRGTSVSFMSTSAISGGCINNAVKLNTSAGTYFLKWNKTAPADMFEREAEGLTEMRRSGNTNLTIPEVLWSKSSDELPGLILMEYLEPAINIAGSDERLGRGIANLHRVTSSAFGFHHSNYCGTTVQDNSWNKTWSEFYAFRRIWALILKIKDTRGMSTDEIQKYEKLLDRLSDLLAHQTVPSLIHGDLWSGNYMYTARGPALIDPACYYADREMELGMMKLFGGFSSAVWEAYQNEYPLPEGWQDRIRLYQLYHVLNHYLIFGGSYGLQAIEIAKAYL